MRIGIIGGGLAGVATAWLAAPRHDVILFEARARLGGHADSVKVRQPSHASPDFSPRSMPDAHAGRDVVVDIGAQYVSRDGFPWFGRLMRLEGLDDAGAAGAALTPAPITLTISEEGSRVPLLVTPHRPDELRGARLAVTGEAFDAISTVLQAAVAFEAAGAAWTVPLAELVEPLALPRRVKDDVIYPWLSHIVCCAPRDAPAVSARAAIAFFTRLAPASAGEAVVWANPTQGMVQLVERLAAQLPPAAIRCARAIERIERRGAQLALVDRDGAETIVDRVVLATPPQAALPLLVELSGTDRARRLLAQFPFTPAVVAIHLDPAYMPSDRRHWSTVCLDLHDGCCEASHWYGPIHGVDVFKSWITYRRDPPSRILARRAFQHIVVTPSAVRAREALAGMQGEAGIYFAGSYMTFIDSQESAVLSAAAVAGHLAPDSARLAQLTDAHTLTGPP